MTIAVASRGLYLNGAYKPGLWSGDTAPTSFYDPVNFPKLSLTSQTQEAVQILSTMDGSEGEVLASVMKTKDAAKMSAESDFMPPMLFGLLLGADITELSQTTAAVTVEPITPILGMWVPLANRYLTAHGTGTEIVAVTSADAAVANTHYQVDLINGLFKALDATGVTVAKLSYKTATRTGEIYKAGKAKSAYIKLVGTATEKVSMRRCRVVIHKVLLSASSDIDIGVGGVVKGTFAGDLITPDTETSPWEIIYTDMAA